MALPGQTFTITDGNIGIASSISDRVLVVGVTTAGTANTITSYSSSSAITAALTGGPAVDTACHILDIAGGSVDILKTAGSVTAANSAITHVGAGPVVTVAGTATNDFSVYFLPTLGGALGVARFKYTLEYDANVPLAATSFSEEITVPAGGTYAIPGTGLTLTFPPGTYIVGDTYAFTTTCATYNGSDLTAALTPLLANSTRYKFIVFAGTQASGATAATIAGSISGWLTSLANQFRFTRAIVTCGTDTESNVNTAFASYTDPRVMLIDSFAHTQIPNKLQGRVSPSLPFTVPTAARAAKCKISTNPAWVGFVDGPLPGVSYPKFDERIAGETVHQNKINAPTTYIGQAGVFLTDALLKSTAGSDFKFWQWGLVIDRACHVIYDVQQKYVGVFFRAKTDGTGSIDPRDAATVNKDARGALRSALLEEQNDRGTKGHCSGFNYAVDETNNILSTGILQSNASVVPFLNVSNIATSIGFSTSVQTAQ